LRAGTAGSRANRGAFELIWSFELTMLTSLSAELLVLARCAVGRRRRLRSNRLVELRAEGSMAGAAAEGGCRGSELCPFRVF
jgi:hypothetical protein